MKQIVLISVVFFALFVPIVVHGQTDEIEKKASITFRNGKYADAENLYRMAIEYTKDEKAVDVLRQKVKTASRAAALQKEAGKAWELGDKTNAMKKYEDLLKLNPDDPIALSRVNEMETAIQLEKAIYWYNKKDYAKALELFNTAGSSTMWNSQQWNVYKRCQMEIDYHDWKTSPSEVLAEARAIRFLAHYPNSIYDNEIRDALFKYYYKSGQIEKASGYVVTSDQKKLLEIAQQSKRNETRKTMQAGSQGTGVSSRKLWEPTLGIAAELSLFGGLNEAALPIELRLFNPYSVLNISFGARIGIRGMLLPDTLRYADENTSYTHQIEASYSYCQISPFVSAKLHLGKDISSGAFFLGVTGRLNYNFNYTFYKTESELNRQQLMYSNKFKYHTKDVLVPITSTIVGELGYGSETIEFYLYYSYDVVNPMDFSKVVQMRSDADNPHSQMLLQTSFADRYFVDGFLGVGLRIYFGN